MFQTEEEKLWNDIRRMWEQSPNRTPAGVEPESVKLPQRKTLAELQQSLPPVKNLREGAEATQKYDIKTDTTSNNALWMDPLQHERLTKMITGGTMTYKKPAREVNGIFQPEELVTDTYEGNPIYLQQKKGAEELEQYAKSLMAPDSRLDLSPLASLVDTWTGSNFSKTYQRPMSAQEQAQKNYSVMSDVQKRREALTDKLEEMIRASRAGFETVKQQEQMNELMKAMIKPQAPDRKKEDPDYKKVERVVAAFNRDPVGRKARERLIAAENAERLVLSGNKMAPEALKTVIPRLLGEVGNLAQAEQERVAGSAAILDRFWRAYERGTVSDLTPTDREAMRELVSMFKESAHNAVSTAAEMYAQQGEGTYGLPSDRFRNAIVAGKKNTPTTQAKPSLSAKDQQALDWAKNNPNDPRAAKIKSKLGVK